MSHLAKDMTPDVTWKDITPGCNIYEGRHVQRGGDRRLADHEARDRLGQVPAVPALRAGVPGYVHPGERRGQAGGLRLLLLQGLRHLRQHLPFGAITIVKDEK